MRQSIFSAIPRILMEVLGIDFVTGRKQEPLLLGWLRGGQRGTLHWEGTRRGPETFGMG